MSKYNQPYIDPAMFTKPPPNFKGITQKWHSFKVPHPPSTMTPTGYNNIQSSTPRNCSRQMPPNPIRDYESNPPPNYFSASSPHNSELPYNSNRSNNKSEVMFNPAQPFKVDVPPPPFNTSHLMQSHTDPNTKFPSNFDEEKANYYLMMLYRYHNYLNAQHPPNANSFSAIPSSESFSLPPPLTCFPPPPQPPLPSLPPPLKPPPPPTPATVSPSTSMTMQNHHMGNYTNNMSPYSMYGHSYPKIHNNFKRKFDGNDAHKKNQKKKKKPLSQVVPQRRDWTLEEAKRALDVEKDCNKRSKRQGLIIKFPDIELNRDIVTNFHSGIESVHFQQPSTPRYCFVTLRESADPETVIRQLNKIPFGTGYLSAEYKKDREDEQNIKPSDIDPLTLYVGNLAQEITKDDMMKTYPKQKRIDIGYAKKMKYTRYAFVSFHAVDDAIEAFQNTHSSQMYSKSLIVRFRRLHGTVGMPGEPKQQIQQPTESESSSVSIPDSCNNSVNDEQESDKEHNPWDIDISQWENDYYETKPSKRSDTATSEDDDDVEIEVKPPLSTPFRTNFMPGSLEAAIALHRPIVVIKEPKEDEVYEDNREDSGCLEEGEDNATGQSDYESHNDESHNEESHNDESPLTNDGNQDPPSPAEVQAVVSKIKQETTENSVAQSSVTSYAHLIHLHQQIQAGLMQFPISRSGKTLYFKKEQDIKKENDDVPGTSSNVQDGERSELPNNYSDAESDLLEHSSSVSSECLNNNSAVPGNNSASNIENKNDNKKKVVTDNAINGKTANNQCDKSKETSNKDGHEKRDKGFGWINKRKN